MTVQPTISPAQLAENFEYSSSTGLLHLKGSTELGGVDTFQVGFGTEGTGSVEVDYLYLSHLNVDLTDYTEVRMSVRVMAAGLHSETMAMQYTTDYTTFTTLGPTLSLTSVGLQQTVWTPLPAAANTVVGVRVGKGGGNATDPVTLSGTILQFRR